MISRLTDWVCSHKIPWGVHYPLTDAVKPGPPSGDGMGRLEVPGYNFINLMVQKPL